MSYWGAVYRFAWGILLVVLVIGLVCIFLPKCHGIQKYQSRKTQLESENRALQDRIARLRKKQDRFRSEPEFVERTAREIGMSKPDEVVFKFKSTSGAEAPDRPDYR